MTILSFAQMEAYWVQAGGPQSVAKVAAAIGEAESGGETTAINPNDPIGNGKTQSSFGWLQISNGTHSPPSPRWADPLVNAQLGVAKYRAAGNTFRDWGTYVSGAYKKFLGGKANVPVVANPGQGDGGGGGGSSPQDTVVAAVSSAGTLLGDAAKALDWFFHLFKPGQGWRIAFGAGSVLAAAGGVKSWQSATQSEDATAALPLAILLFALSALAAFMTLRQWPQPGDKPIKPGAYAVDIIEGKAPAAGPQPVSDADAIEVGLAAILALWAASKAAQGLSGIGGIIGGILTFLGLKGAGGGGAPVEVPPVEAVP